MNTKKILRWAGAMLALLPLITILAAVVIVHTDAFRRYVLEQIEQKTYSSIGARLDIGRMAINWRLLSFDFYDVRLAGREVNAEPPLFVADHLRVGLKIISILGHRVDLNEIAVDRPIVHIRVDERGNSNLPQAQTASAEPASMASSVAEILNLAIGHVAVNSGQLDYNDRQIPIEAELINVQTKIDFSHLANEGHGSLSYAGGHIVIKDFKPVSHGLDLNFAVGRNAVNFDQAKITVGKSTITAHAKMTNYSDPRIEGTYEGEVSTTDLGDIMHNVSIPLGVVALAGNLRYQGAPDKTVIENLYIDGKLSSGQLVATVGQMVANSKSIRGDYQLKDGNLRVTNVDADLLGGQLRADYSMLHLAGNSSSTLDISIKNASLGAIQATASDHTRQSIKFAGTVDANVGASWSARIQDADAQVHVFIRGGNRRVTQGSPIPLNGLIDVRYQGAQNLASFGQSNLSLGSTTLVINGTLSDRSRLDAHVNVADLQEAESLVSVLRRVDSDGSTPAFLGLRGAARFDGQVLGTVKDPRVRGNLSATNLAFRKTTWRSLRVDVDAAPSQVSLQNGSLIATQKGQIDFGGSAGLRDWKFVPANPISIDVTARQMSIADLQQLAQQNYPVTGVLAAKISLHGTAENPQGQGSLQISQGSAWQEPISNLTVNFEGDGNAIHSKGQVSSPAGNLTADIDYMPKSQTYQANVHAPEIKLDQIQTPRFRELNLTGVVTLSATGQGSFSNPQLRTSLQIPKLTVREQSISEIRAQLNIANQHATYSLSSKADKGFIQSKGDVELTGEYSVNASLDVQSLPVAVILAGYLTNTRNLQGETELHAKINGPLKNPAEMTAELEVPKLDLAYESTSLGLEHPLRVSYRGGLATIEQADFKGTGTSLSLKGTIPIKNAAALNVSAKGTIDLAILEGFASGVRSSGRIDLDVAATGGLTHPVMRGQVRIASAALSTDSVPVGIEGLNGVIQISGNRIEISQFSGAAGGGTISARGFATYGEQSNFNLGLDLKSVRIRYPDGIRSILSGNIALNGTSASSQLTGRVLIDRLSFTQKFDLATFMGQFSTDSPPSESPFERAMKLNIAVSSAEDLNLASSKVNLGGSANLTVVGTLASPVILGRTTLNSGEMFFMGKRYEIQNGTIEFANPARTTPVVNVYVKTTVQQYDITLNFVGPMNRLRTNYISDPPLPPSDIINLIAFGKTAEQAATSPSTPAALGAESVLAQNVAGKVSGKLENVTGISQLTIDPSLGGNQTDAGARVAIQQRVTGNILLTFSTDVTSTENQAVQLQYQVKKNLSISVLRDEYGGYAADVRLHKTF